MTPPELGPSRAKSQVPKSKSPGTWLPRNLILAVQNQKYPKVSTPELDSSGTWTQPCRSQVPNQATPPELDCFWFIACLIPKLELRSKQFLEVYNLIYKPYTKSYAWSCQTQTPYSSVTFISSCPLQFWPNWLLLLGNTRSYPNNQTQRWNLKWICIGCQDIDHQVIKQVNSPGT